MKTTDGFLVKRLASSLILISGVAHILLGVNNHGFGQITLLIFGASYLLTSILILKGVYAAGLFVPLAGMLTGLLLFEAGSVNLAFVSLEVVVIGLSVLLLQKVG